jgi:hypothetical protein
MRYFEKYLPHLLKINILIFLVFIPGISNAQLGGRPVGPFGLPPIISLGVHLDPIISWFSTDINEIRNEGARPGFNFGISCYRYFSPNYSFSTGISIINSGGRLISNNITRFELVNYTDKIVTVEAGEAIVYKVQYLSVPLGIKLQTNQIGYITFFSDLGLDPKILIGGKANIPSLDIKGAKATSELKKINLSYHIMAGIEYAVGGSTAAVLGLGFDNNFLDITKDIGDQPMDKVSHKLLSFRFGVIF